MMTHHEAQFVARALQAVLPTARVSVDLLTDPQRRYQLLSYGVTCCSPQGYYVGRDLDSALLYAQRLAGNPNAHLSRPAVLLVDDTLTDEEIVARLAARP